MLRLDQLLEAALLRPVKNIGEDQEAVGVFMDVKMDSFLASKKSAGVLEKNLLRDCESVFSAFKDIRKKFASFIIWRNQLNDNYLKQL